MTQERGGCVAVLFPFAALAVGAFGAAVLYGWGGAGTVPIKIALPLAGCVELALYLLIASKRLRRLAIWAWPLGLCARALMAAGSSLVWPAPNGFVPSFVMYLGSYWPAIAVQLLIAAFIVWFVADISAPPLPQVTEPVEPARRRISAKRQALLGEILSATPQPREPRHTNGIEEGEPEEVAVGEAEAAAPAEILPEEPQLTEPIAAEVEGSRASPGAPDLDEETSELRPIDAGADALVLSAAVAEAVAAVTGLSGFRPAGRSPAGVEVVANIEQRIDDGAFVRICTEMAALARVLGEAGLLGEPQGIAVVMRAGGAYMVASASGLAFVNVTSISGAGELVASARRLASRLSAQWPAPLFDLPEARAADPAAPSIDDWATSARQRAAWYSVAGCGLVAIVAPAGSDDARMAAAGGALWAAVGDLGRCLSAGGPRRIIGLFAGGAAAIGMVQPAGASPFVVVRAATGAQAGLVVAELERICALAAQHP
ncbi:MAG: hypothetical protein H5T86_07190 [Armatimonadetes bacterium]|nr:hypothetical protein [Armatimonadota bacterium]